MVAPIKIAEKTVDAFILGDIEAFKIIYLATKDFVFTVIVRIIGNKHDSEDIMHDVYIKLFEKRREYKKEKAILTTWLYKISVNQALTFYRRKSRQVNINNEVELCDDLLDNYVDQEEYVEIMKALQKVPEIYRICLVLKEMENLSYEEISKILGINIGTVRSRINRAKESLSYWYHKGGALCVKKK